MEKKSIGAFIAVLRKANGMTQRELAEKLNVSDKAVSRWERDETLPDLSMIPVLAELFGVTSDELLRGQRITREEPMEERQEKTAKRLQYLLDKAMADCRICTLVSCLLAALGLVMTVIFNRLLEDFILAFFMGTIFLVAGVAVQLMGKVKADGALTAEEFDGQALMRCRRSLLRQTMLGICVNIGAVNMIWTLLPRVNLPIGSLFVAVMTVWLAASLGICSYIHRKKGFGHLFQRETWRKLWTAVLLGAVLIGTAVGIEAVWAHLRVLGRPQYFWRLLPVWFLLFAGEILAAILIYHRKK